VDRAENTKRLIDLLGSVILLALFLPLMGLVALIVRLESPGPILFSQERLGRLGRPFTIYKFRTMHAHTPCLSTEEMQRLGAMPYTRLGPFLRKSSLDELPQLINILKGQMSFIGPRPALPTQLDVNQLRLRMGVVGVRPGITGLAQVNGRDDLDTETKVGYDAEYCRMLSFLLDVKIILQTAAAVVSARGNK
jgi:lipopolysaccharide/colanic/teichoic acid biosynthesis glycosyltransferase